MLGSKRLIVTAAVSAVASQLALSSAARAANVVWDGGSATTSNLSDNVNWVGDVLPGLTDFAQFAGSVRTTPVVSAPVQYNSLYFLAGASAFDIGGTNAITLGGTTAGNYLNNDTVGVLQTISAPVNLIGGTVNATQGSLTFNGAFNVGNGANAVAGNNVTFFANTNNTININGSLLGTGTATSTGGAITKTGNGAMNVTTANAAWAGNVFINGGTLRINNANALGSGGGRIETALTSGGTGLGALELDGTAGGFTLAKPVTVRARQGTTINEVSLRNIAGNNTISNVTTGSGGSQFNFDSVAGNLTIDNWNTVASTGARQLRMIGAGNGQINNWTAAAGSVFSLIKEGTGTWTLPSTVAGAVNNYGTVNIAANGGQLTLGAGNGQKVTGNITINTGGTLRVETANGVDGEVGVNATPTTLSVLKGGTLDAIQFSEYSLQPGQTLIAGGTVKTGGKFITYGDNAIYVGNNNTTGIGTWNVVGNLSITNAFATATGGLRFNLANVNTIGNDVNDLISVQGDLLVDGTSGAIPLYITQNNGTLATGTYRLIDFTSGSTPNASDFSIVGASSGTSRQTFAVGTAPGQVNLVVSGSVANLVWKGDGSGNAWDIVTSPNWLNGVTADKYYQGDAVTFDDSSTNQTVNLTGSLIPSNIVVNSTKDYVFAGAGTIDGTTGLTKSGSGSLTIANTANNTFNGPIALNAGTLIYDTAATNTPGLISGAGNLVKRGAGVLVLNQANTLSGNVTVEAGTVQTNSSAAFGDAVGTTAVLSGGSIFILGPASTFTENFTIAGDGPTAGAGALHTGGAVPAILNGNVVMSAASTFNTDGGADLTVNGNITGVGALTKTGSGWMFVNGAGSSWTGGTTVNGGTLFIGNATSTVALPAGPVSVATGTGLAFGSNAVADVSNTITGAGIIWEQANGGTTRLTGDLTGFTGTIATGNVGVESKIVIATATNASVLRVTDNNGGINNPNGGGNQQGLGYGILRVENSNALAATGTIDIGVAQLTGRGRLELGNNVNLTAASLATAQRNLTGGPTALTLANYTELTPAIRSTDGTNTLNAPITITTGGTFAGLDVSAGSDFTVAGGIKAVEGASTSNRNLVLMGDGVGRVTGVIANNSTNDRLMNVTKLGNGTWTLSGANTYTGTNSVLAGTLVYGVGAATPVLGTDGMGAGAQGIDILGGKAAFKFADAAAGDTLAANVGSLLTTGYGQTPKFSLGTIRSSTVATATNRILGWARKNADSQVEVALTLPGDSNLDYAVNFDDLLALAQNYSTTTTGRVWSNGDFNYSGIVDFDDLLALAQNYNQSLSVGEAALVGADFAADYALARSLVPEPTTFVAFGLGLAGLVRRNRKSTVA